MPSRLGNPLSGHHLNLQYFSATGGLYIQPPLDALSTGTAVNGVCHFTWMPLSRQYIIGRLASNCTISGDAGASVRFGIYRNGPNGLPSTLVVDAGTALAAAGTVQSNQIFLTLDSGGYWAAIVGQGATTVPTFTTVSLSAIPMVGNVQPEAAINIGFTLSGVTGPLPPAPTGFTRVTSYIPVAPLVYPTNA
jgi:hypothetical protein